MLRVSKDIESPIKAILFCEFHHQYGPKITYQVPETYVSKEIFDILSVYIITKRELNKNLITINALGYKILGYPVYIGQEKYERNALIFNMCFVCDANKRTIQYEPLVRKLAEYLVTLELESDFLSNETSKARLPKIMTGILTNLNNTGVCTVPIGKNPHATPYGSSNDSNTIHLKVIKTLSDPVQVEDYLVPVLLVTKKTIMDNHLDLTALQVLPYIDGFKHIGRIAAEAEVEISLVKACIQNFAYYGFVALIPIFQYSNMYTTLPELHNFTQDADLQLKCLEYVAKCDRVPDFKDVFVMYCGLTPGTTVKDLCCRYLPHSLGIDERKLIQFGLIHSFIRRLQKFPVLLPSDSNSRKKDYSAPAKYFTGHCNYDDICCKTGLNFHELDEHVEGDTAVVVCWK